MLNLLIMFVTSTLYILLNMDINMIYTANSLPYEPPLWFTLLHHLHVNI